MKYFIYVSLILNTEASSCDGIVLRSSGLIKLTPSSGFFLLQNFDKLIPNILSLYHQILPTSIHFI